MDPFIRQVFSVIQAGSSLVELLVVDASIDDIFDELDLSATVMVAASGKEPTAEFATGRRLVWGWVKKGVNWVKGMSQQNRHTHN